jgi:hypothetical protein
MVEIKKDAAKELKQKTKEI